MSADLYAVTHSGFRAVSPAMALLEGEALVTEIPEALLIRIKVEQTKAERNSLLRASDWTQVPDSPLSAEDRQAWAVYRQALRDLPEAPGFPDGEWPTPPALADGAADVDKVGITL